MHLSNNTAHILDVLLSTKALLMVALSVRLFVLVLALFYGSGKHFLLRLYRLNN